MLHCEYMRLLAWLMDGHSCAQTRMWSGWLSNQIYRFWFPVLASWSVRRSWSERASWEIDDHGEDGGGRPGEERRRKAVQQVEGATPQMDARSAPLLRPRHPQARGTGQYVHAFPASLIIFLLRFSSSIFLNIPRALNLWLQRLRRSEFCSWWEWEDSPYLMSKAICRFITTWIRSSSLPTHTLMFLIFLR